MAGPQNWCESFHYRLVLGTRLNTQSNPVVGRQVCVVIDAGVKSVHHPSACKSQGNWPRGEGGGFGWWLQLA